MMLNNAKDNIFIFSAHGDYGLERRGGGKSDNYVRSKHEVTNDEGAEFTKRQ